MVSVNRHPQDLSTRIGSRTATRDDYASHDYGPLRSAEALDDLRSAFDLG